MDPRSWSFWLLTLLGTHLVESAAGPPKIGISRWMSRESVRDSRYMWEDGGLAGVLLSGAISIQRKGTEMTFVVAQHIERLQILCNATYPVSWVSPESEFHPDALYSSAYSVFETRLVKNVRDPKSFLYQSTLDIYENSGTASRNYSCQSLAQPALERSLYIFWEGNTFLTFAGLVLDVQTMDNKTVVLPCTLTRPDVTVFLFKETETGSFAELLRNESITFNPKVGFSLKLETMQSPYGRFKCVSEDEAEDDDGSSVRINVLHGWHDPAKGLPHFPNKLSANATFEYDSEKRKLECCSSSAKPPNLKSIYCHHPLSCKGKERLLNKISATNRWDKNGSCASMEVYPRDSGILRCKGDDVDVFRTYFTSISGWGPDGHQNNVSLFYRLEEVPPRDLMAVMAPGGEALVYVGQNFTAYCDVSGYYFSKGIQWALRWRNNSLQFLDGEFYNPNAGDRRFYHGAEDYYNVMFPVHKDMDAVLCYAPIWNSSQWLTSDLKMDIRDTIPPTVLLLEEEGVHWALNETGRSLTCRANGEPMPSIAWTLDNRTLEPGSSTDFDILTDEEKGRSVISFRRVGHGTQGNYFCTGTSFVGTDQESVRVYIKASPLPGSSVGLVIFIATTVSFLLLAGIGFLVWKLKLQKKIINHLTGVVFRDVDK